MSKEISKSPEMLHKEARVKALNVELKKARTKLKSLKTRLANTQQEVEDIQRGGMGKMMGALEKMESLRQEIKVLAGQLKTAMFLSKADRKQLKMLEEELSEADLFGGQMEDFMEQKAAWEAEQKVGGGEGDRAKNRDLFEQFRVEPKAEEIRDIRKVFIRLSTQLHPDKAKNEKDAETFHTLMQQINEAYKNNDIHTLLEMESIYIHSQTDPLEGRAITTDVLQGEIERLEKELSFLNNQAKRMSKEIKSLRASDLGQMLTQLNQAKRQGRGIDDEFEEMQSHLATLSKLRDALKDTQQQKRFSPLLEEVMMEMSSPAPFNDFEEPDDMDFLMDMMSDFFENEEMQIKLLKKPKFPVGSSVKISASVFNQNVPDVNMKRWQGRVVEAFKEGKAKKYFVEMDSVTIAQMPDRLLKQAILRYEDRAFHICTFDERQLEAVPPRDTPAEAIAQYRKAYNNFVWDKIKNPAGHRIKEILLTHPEQSDLENWSLYLRQKLSFPIEAEVLGILQGIPIAEKVTIREMTDIDEEFGIIVNLLRDTKGKGKKKMEPYPLLNLSCADKADKNFQAISDYCYWAETELM